MGKVIFNIIYTPVEEQTEEDIRMQKAAAHIFLGLPLTGDLAIPPKRERMKVRKDLQTPDTIKKQTGDKK